MINPLCETCKWWGGERAHNDDMPFGSCRVRAPSYGELVGAYDRGRWYWTAIDDWCGEHKPKVLEGGK